MGDGIWLSISLIKHLFLIVILPEWLQLILYCLFGNSSVTVPDLFH